MKIYVDADACPNPIKTLLFRASTRKKIPLVLVANHPLTKPDIPLIQCIQVPKGFDVADNAILQDITADDLVITADIPLAHDVLMKGTHALNPRGELYSTNTIKQKLSMRNAMETLRSSGHITSGPKPMNPKDIQRFANALDRLLARY